MNTSRDNFVASAVLAIEQYTGISLPFEKVDEIVGNKMEYEWGDPNFEYKQVSSSMDTSPREEVMELLALHYIGRNWPCYMDHVDMKGFSTELVKNMMKDMKGFSK